MPLAIKIIKRIAVRPIEVQPAVIVTSKAIGCLAIDAGHIALAVADRFGNPIEKSTIPVDPSGSTCRCLVR